MSFPDPASVEAVNRQVELAEKISQQQGIPIMTALIMAGDRMSEDRAREAIDKGTMTAIKAVSVLVGSYQRFQMFIDLVEEGKISEQELLENILSLWRGSDPDDTNTDFMMWWEIAHELNGYEPLTDGSPLPDDEFISVYRGQTDPEDILGLSWTTDPRVAMRFAEGAALRTSGMNGSVLTGMVHRKNILAYITQRKESEVVVNPDNVQVLGVTPVRKFNAKEESGPAGSGRGDQGAAQEAPEEA